MGAPAPVLAPRACHVSGVHPTVADRVVYDRLAYADGLFGRQAARELYALVQVVQAPFAAPAGLFRPPLFCRPGHCARRGGPRI